MTGLGTVTRIVCGEESEGLESFADEESEVSGSSRTLEEANTVSPPPDERPLLVCRVDCPPPLQEELDGWTPEHFDDFGRHDAVLAASSYKVIRDFEPDSGLPAAFNASQATRFIVYVAADIPEMHAWIGSDVVTGGLDEPTLEREAKYPPLEEEPFNGTMMTVSNVLGALGRETVGHGGCVVERFEVGTQHEDEFDAWLEETHLNRYAKLDGWVRIRTLRGDRTADDKFPWNRYLGKGNRMLWCELEEGTDPKELVRSREYREILSDSLQWDSVLPYITREACEEFIVRDLSQIPAAV